MKSACRLGVLAMAVLLSGCKNSASGPGNPNPAGASVSGTLVSTLTNLAVAGATVHIDGVGDATSAADGTFTLPLSDESNQTRAVVVSSPNTLERSTWLTTPGPAGTLTLIPSSFDLGAFDEMFRGNFQALRRWTAAPALIVQRRTLTFSTLTDPNSVATGSLMSDDEVNQLIADFTFALPQLTGNTFSAFASVSSEFASPGDLVQVVRSNVIFAARYQGLTAGSGFAGYTRWTWLSTGQVVLGTIMLDQNFDNSSTPQRRALRSHELGHALSYNHVTKRTSVMNPTPVVDPNTFDRDASRVAFMRPPLNRSPDTDPNPTTVSTRDTRLFTAGAP